MMNLLDITTATVDWSRAQFALTAIYHWLFVPLTLGLAVIMGIVETCYYRTRKTFWKDTARFWQRLFGINFAMGVATGIILEFEFGTNWSNYSWFVGDIFGTPLAIEGIFAFFMEATFVAVMFFGWKKVSPGFHLASTWLTGLGATLSAWWILVANAWMQDPIGSVFNPDTMRFEMSSFAKIALSPFAVDKFFHTVTSSWVIGAVFCVAVCGWYLLRHREEKLAKESMKIAAIVGLASSVLTVVIGDNSAVMVSQVQPMKLAAMEALYNGGNDQPLTFTAAVNPFKQPDYVNERETSMKIGIPHGLSLLATRSISGYVPGINDLLNGYRLPDGSREPSVRQKMAMGRKAIVALAQYRSGKKDAVTKKTIMDNIKYFGYGYVRNPHQVVPFIPVNFWAFRVMVGVGLLLILFFIVDLFMVYRRDISRYRWLSIVALIFLPLTYLASESGWLVAEFGRQPWTIQDMLPTWVAVSDIHSGSVALTFFIFLILFTTMLAVEICILCKQIKKGPDHTENETLNVNA
jgi:cytochrome d ubiquinol oxidase subunit I